MSDIKAFIQESKFLILFFVLLDPITTYAAINGGYGYEGNVIMSLVLSSGGLVALFLLKSFFLLPVFCVYYECSRGRDARLSRIWKATNSSIAVFGALLVINNIMAIMGHPGIFQLALQGGIL